MSKFLNDKPFFNKLMINHLTAIALAIALSASLLPHIPAAYATAAVPFALRTSQQVYVPGETLEVYGTAEPNQVLLFRLYDPTGLAIRIENVPVNEEGSYRAGIFNWPEPSRNLAFGAYTVEALSGIEGTDPLRLEVSFAGGFDQGIDPSRPHILAIKLDSPSQVTVNSVFRIFVQITFDGALVEAADEEAVAAILGSSHIHSRNSTINLGDRFIELHPGLYYVDVNLPREDAYVIHAVAFYRGFLSHDSRVIAASASSIGTVQESVDQLNAGLNSTNHELDLLQERLGETQSALTDTKDTITNLVEEARTSIRDDIELAQQASGQFNSLILPMLALISVIIALQISLFARIRASYR
jgi:hypothetical protein